MGCTPRAGGGLTWARSTGTTPEGRRCSPGTSRIRRRAVPGTEPPRGGERPPGGPQRPRRPVRATREACGEGRHRVRRPSPRPRAACRRRRRCRGRPAHRLPAADEALPGDEHRGSAGLEGGRPPGDDEPRRVLQSTRPAPVTTRSLRAAATRKPQSAGPPSTPPHAAEHPAGGVAEPPAAPAPDLPLQPAWHRPVSRSTGGLGRARPTRSVKWPRAASSACACSGRRPLRGASTALVPWSPSRGVSSSVASDDLARREAVTTAGRPSRASSGASARATPRASAESGPAPRAASRPAPPSFVLLPTDADDDLARSPPRRRLESSPHPHVLVRAGSRSPAARRCRPVACDASTYARAPPPRRRRGPRRAPRGRAGRSRSSRRSCRRARRARTSRNPGPPSDSGEQVDLVVRRAAAPALRHRLGRLAGARRAEESGAMSTRMRRYRCARAGWHHGRRHTVVTTTGPPARRPRPLLLAPWARGDLATERGVECPGDLPRPSDPDLVARAGPPRPPSATACSSSATTTSATRSSSSPTSRATRSSSPSRGGAARRRVHRLLRRALHGRVRGHPHRRHQTVVLPDLAAGCSMADMAAIDQVEECWDELADAGVAGVTVPGDLHELLRRHQGVHRPQRRHGLHLLQRPGAP